MQLISIVCCGILGLIILLFICVTRGFLPVMRLLGKIGLPICSGKTDVDSQFLAQINSDGVAWLNIPDICYGPILRSNEGFYARHNFLKQGSMLGEFSLIDDKRQSKVAGIRKEVKGQIPDLSIIQGDYRGKCTNMRKANFSLLRKVREQVRDNTVIEICENGVMREFQPVAFIEKGIEDGHSFRFRSRQEFINNLLRMSRVISDNIHRDAPMLILQCRTDIDIVMVLIEERGCYNNGKEKRKSRE